MTTASPNNTTRRPPAENTPAHAIRFLLQHMVLGTLGGFLFGAMVLYFDVFGLGGLVLGCLAAALPAVRFSGHHEFDAMLQWGGGATAPALIGLALIKLLACAICLATGWRGGAIFPLVFAGGAAGLPGA